MLKSLSSDGGRSTLLPFSAPRRSSYPDSDRSSLPGSWRHALGLSRIKASSRGKQRWRVNRGLIGLLMAIFLLRELLRVIDPSADPYYYYTASDEPAEVDAERDDIGSIRLQAHDSDASPGAKGMCSDSPAHRVAVGASDRNCISARRICC